MRSRHYPFFIAPILASNSFIETHSENFTTTTAVPNPKPRRTTP